MNQQDRSSAPSRYTEPAKSSRIDSQSITKQGQLSKRGNIFSGFSTKYLFYLEGDILRYGKKGKPILNSIDLKDAKVQKNPESKTKFKILYGKNKLKLKADTYKECQEWVSVLSALAKGNQANGRRTMQVSDIKDLESISGNQDQRTKKSTNNKKKTDSPSKKRSTQKPGMTLSQLTDELQSQDSKLNKLIESSQNTYDVLVEYLQKLELELNHSKFKSHFQKLSEQSTLFQASTRQLFEMISNINQNVYRIVEGIAEKAIEKDPLEFIKQESFVVPSDRFQSFADNLNMYNPVPDQIAEEEEDKEETDMNIEQNMSNYNNSNNDMEFEESKRWSGEGMGYHEEDNQPNVVIDQDHLVEELDEIFHDANDYFPSTSIAITNTPILNKELTGTLINEDIMSEESKGDGNHHTDDSDNEPVERQQLPYFKDPKVKISIWTILKDSLGKDITKMSMPVYFNDPTNMLQRIAGTQEYNHLLDEAIVQQDALKRLAYICAYQISCVTNMERNNSKPFNPLLGETFEFVTNKYKFLSELVSHHPPICAWEVRGNSGYKKYSNSRVRQKFTGRALQFNACYKDYIELEPHNERYEITNATITAHNLIVGSPYLDVKDKAVVKCLTRPGEYGVIHYYERGWNQNSYFRLNGEVYNAKKEVVYKLEGKWNSYVDLICCKTGDKQRVWEKNPYPENWAYQYGLSQFMIQLNYLPNFLKKKIPHTDTRLRPDQRALENGDLKMAADEKNRLEEKQRAVRRFREKNGIEHKPAYFEQWENPDDNNMIYWRYNGLYFEKDRKEQNWIRLPDLFSDKLPKEIEEFEKSRKQQNAQP